MAGTFAVARPREYWLPFYLGLQLLVVLACVAAFRLSPPLPPQQFRLPKAEIAHGVAWLPVTLPDFRGRPEEATALIYRLPLAGPVFPSSGPWSIFVPRFTTGIELAINGSVIFDSRLDPAAGRPDRNTPAIAPIPDALLHDVANEVTVRLFNWGPLDGYLESVYAGPDAELRPAYEQRRFLFQTIPLVLAAWQATLATILGLIWINRRHDVSYGLLAAAMAIGAGQHFIPLPAPQILHGLLGASVSIESALVLQFIGRSARVRLPRISWLTFLPASAIIAAALIGRPEDLRLAYMLLGPASIGLNIALIGIVLGWAAVARKDGECLFLGTVFTVVLTFWVHDVLMISNSLGGERIFIGRLSYSAVLIAIGIGVTWRFIQALNEADSFASRLIMQVREAEEKLRASFAREEEQARNEAMAAERTRLMRDLHDGLGGQLVSIVALAEQANSEKSSIGEAARAALKDLRLVIDAMEDVDGDLMLVLGSWRERIAAQLRAHDIRLLWEVRGTGLPVFTGLRPWHVIQVVRLLDEAVTNAVKHSGAATLQVTVGALEAEYGRPAGRIAIRDDGRGFGAAGTEAGPWATGHTGRGLPNMRRRAELVGARLAVTSDADGTCIELTLPPEFGASDGGLPQPPRH